MKTARWQPRSPASELQLFIRIKHPSLDPTEISRTLDAAPEEAIAAGPNISTTGVRRLHSETYWIGRLAVPSVDELVKKVREQALSQQPALGKEEFAHVMGSSMHDVRIMSQLTSFERNKAFFDRINREGGSITLIIDSGEAERPIVLNKTLRKLAELGMALEVG